MIHQYVELIQVGIIIMIQADFECKSSK
jgi:hypothetical protein